MPISCATLNQRQSHKARNHAFFVETKSEDALRNQDYSHEGTPCYTNIALGCSEVFEVQRKTQKALLICPTNYVAWGRT